MKGVVIKKIYYCEECGQTFLREKRPIVCNAKHLLDKIKCKSRNFERMLTERDLK